MNYNEIKITSESTGTEYNLQEFFDDTAISNEYAYTIDKKYLSVLLSCHSLELSVHILPCQLWLHFMYNHNDRAIELYLDVKSISFDLLAPDYFVLNKSLKRIDYIENKIVEN